MNYDGGFNPEQAYMRSSSERGQRMRQKMQQQRQGQIQQMGQNMQQYGRPQLPPMMRQRQAPTQSPFLQQLMGMQNQYGSGMTQQIMQSPFFSMFMNQSRGGQ